MRTQQSKTTSEIEQAHALLGEGHRDEAYAVVSDILQRQPDNTMARALRDRIDNEEFSRAVVRQRERQDSFEEEDVSPLLPVGLLIVAVVAFLVATYLAIKPVRLGFQVGFTSEIELGGKLLGTKSQYPVHILLVTPVLLYILSAMCVYGFRRYRNS